jgi:hypothetical protein
MGIHTLTHLLVILKGKFQVTTTLNPNQVRLVPSVLDALTRIARQPSDAPVAPRALALLEVQRHNKDGSVIIAPEPAVARHLADLTATLLERDFRDEQGLLYADRYSPTYALAARRLEQALTAVLDRLTSLSNETGR